MGRRSKEELTGLGEEAVNHTRGVLTIGPSNRDGAKPEALQCIREMRAAQSYEDLEVLTQIRKVAEDATSTGCGNCGEHAAIAFKYLYDKGVRPIEYGWITGGDHAFVIIGRATDDWDGHSAIVVDAWAGKVFPLSEWPGAGLSLARYEF